MSKITENFKLALSMLTRIPTGKINMSETDWPESCMYFPVCGYIIAILAIFPGTLIYHCNPQTSPILSAAWSLFALIFFTGAMHIDGLADICDGFGCHADKSKREEIMHDPRIGTFGISGIILSSIIKFAALYAIFTEQAFIQAGSIIVIARTIMVVVAYYGKPVSDNGLGALVISKINRKVLLYTFIISIPCLVLVIPAAAAMLISAYVLTKKSDKLIGGINGDVLGASCEAAETIGLFAVAFISLL